jgi:recombination protein RecR
MHSRFPIAISRLIDAFASLPGIGEKTATRLVFHLIRSPQQASVELGEAAAELRRELKLCEKCRNVCDSAVCGVCSDNSRSTSQILIVEEALDVLAFEKANGYKGVYHVLHGVLNPLEGIGPESLTIAHLIERVKGGGVEEIILAMNPSVEGEATAMYLTKQLQPFNIKTTRLARGLPTGSELSYADEVTLSAALNGRREY